VEPVFEEDARGCAPRLDGLSNSFHVVLAEQHRHVGLTGPQLTDLGVLYVQELERFQRPVRVLLQDEEIRSPHL
jgi:hypothetical protein